ncbi:calmodulin-binding transcription activator 2 isoform X1 [Triplophysa rosa]|uniref:calmodulin-binding transcription activator 2 isoform X1 n=1 Tax=Triplophysa rosa TaxID=992332 RepID=UPI002545F8CE|nr:calmodulin-binding transcription activator 2 isoform X1 [Triplophysa rosa]
MTFIMNNKDGAKETESGAQMKVFLPNKLLECLPPTSSLPKERLRWNTNEEIASFLVSFDRHEEWLACTLKTRPQNGSIILYNRKKVKYRKDGYCWKKRKDGKTTREDHMKLKVQGIECLYGCYVHSSIVPTFHRRCYWLLQNPDIVLVHYLNVPSLEESVKSCGPVSCTLTDRRDSMRWSRDELLSQLKPMFHSMKWSCGGISAVEFSVEQMVQQILETQQTKPQPRTHTCLCASPGSNIPHRCTSTKHRIISPKLPTCPAPYPALTELQNLDTESSVGEAGREVTSGEAVVAVVPLERKVTSSKPEDSGRVVTEDTGGVASPCSSSSSSSPPQTQRAATIALGNGNGFYGDQRGGLTTVALPQNAVIVMTTAATVGLGGEDSKSESGPTRLSLTRAGSRLVLSPVPPKRDTPPPPTSTSPPSLVPANQGVATLSLTLLPSPVIGGLVLTDRIIPEAPGTLMQLASPSPSLLPFDPDSFLNSPKQGQTYGGPSLPSHISIHSIYSSSTPSPVPSISPQAPSLALSLSPTSPPSSLSSLSSEAERKSIAGRPSSSPSSLSPLSLSLSPSRSTPELLPLCLESSLGLDPLTQPLSPALCTQEPTSSLSAEGKGPPAGLDTQSAPNHLLTNQFSLSQHMSNQLVSTSQVHRMCPSLEVLPTNRSPPKGEELQLLASNSTCIQQQNMTPPASTPINGQMSPVQVKEERSPPTQVHFESEVTPMDTTHSSDSTHMDNQETGLTFDSTFPDLISELITEDTINHAPNPPVYPIRYMVPPQPTPSTSFLPFPLLTHMSSGSAEDTHRLASITDFSPEWSYPEGGVKVLITGPWSETDARYSCVFDLSRVPASLIQPGVLRCYCPAHEAGLVALHVWMDSRVVSSSVLFEYRARNASSLPSSQLDWLSLDDNQFRMSILERLEQMERRMTEMRRNNQQHVYQYHQQQQLNQNPATRITPENQSGVWFEHRIVAVCERMMSGGRWERDAERETLTHSVRHRGMTLLHLAAAQGYTQLIHTLMRWRSLSVNSLTLEQEVDPLNVDHFSCTPLMWACALGHQAAAVLLYRWNSAALGIPDSLGRLPLAVAHSRGHTRLARCLEELHTQEHTRDSLSPTYRPSSPLSSSPDTGLSSSSSVPSPSDPPSPSPSSAYSSGSVPDPMDSASSPSSPLSVPPPADSLFLMDYETASPPSAPPPHSNTMSLADELLDYSENAENEDFLSADVLQVDMTTLAEQIIEATPERIKQEEFNREAESPLRERRDNPAIHDTMPWLAPYLDTVDRSLCAAPPSPLSDLVLQRLRPPSSAAWAEFLNASANGRMERDFALLTLTDTEQRELYEAARVIQNAFRRYKGRRLKEQQDMAAAVIQRCYRKYKQLTWIALKYALYKKMTQAAILIQSKFRSYYEQKKFQQSRRAAVLIQQYYRSYKEYERVKQGPRGPGTLNTRIKGSFLTKKQDQAARKIMRFLRRCRHRIKELKQSKELERRGLTT